MRVDGSVLLKDSSYVRYICELIGACVHCSLLPPLSITNDDARIDRVVEDHIAGAKR